MTFRPLSAKAPAALLKEAKPLQSLFSEAQRLSQLQLVLEAQLEPAACAHCKVAAWRDGHLVLIVSDGQWATRLRYREKRLLQQLGTFAEFTGLQRISFKVRPPSSPPQSAGHPVSLSPDAARSIQASAEGINDPLLRAALERLASHAKPVG